MLSLAAAAALLKYVEHIQNVIYAPGSLKVEFQSSKDTTLIDVETVKNVELLVPLSNPKSPNSLFGLLNHCTTPGGVRLLRANLFQPPLREDVIEARLDAVEELIEKPGIFHSLQSIVGRFCDIDQLLSLCVVLPKEDSLHAFEQRLNNVIGLKHALELVEPLHTVLHGTESRLLDNIRHELEDPRFRGIFESVTDVVHENARVQKGSAAMRLQRCFALKNGLDGLLDVARRTYCEIVDDIEAIVAKLSEDHGIPLKVGYNAVRGYHVQIPSGGKRQVAQIQIRDLPRSFLQPQQFKNVISFTTEEIVQADQRSQEALREITVMSNRIIQSLLGSIRESIGCLYKLSESISTLDLVLSLTSVSMRDEFVRPTFGPLLAIREGRHPILIAMGGKEVVGNDATATAEANFHLLTGANMSGKSTFLRQLVLLQVTAQIGCYVPAESANFRLADAIFSRIGTGDSIECNASTFMLEMRETAHILANVGQRSLVILDELGRGTSSDEGSSFCWAIAEELAKTSAFTFLATHFMLITRMELLYCTVVK